MVVQHVLFKEKKKLGWSLCKWHTAHIPPPPFAPLPLANNSQPCLAAAWQNSQTFLPLYISAMTFVIFWRETCTWPTNLHAKIQPIEI